jgi:hypothetical protein
VKQLLEMTREGKLSWTTTFEDGQFTTVLPGGQLAFVVQVEVDVHRFLMLEEKQEAVLDGTITKADSCTLVESGATELWPYFCCQ